MHIGGNNRHDFICVSKVLSHFFFFLINYVHIKTHKILKNSSSHPRHENICLESWHSFFKVFMDLNYRKYFKWNRILEIVGCEKKFKFCSQFPRIRFSLGDLSRYSHITNEIFFLLFTLIEIISKDFGLIRIFFFIF